MSAVAASAVTSLPSANESVARLRAEQDRARESSIHIPFGGNAESELRNIQRLLRAGRAEEAERRLTRLFDDGRLKFRAPSQRNPDLDYFIE